MSCQKPHWVSLFGLVSVVSGLVLFSAPASAQLDDSWQVEVNGQSVPVDADGETWWRLEGLGWASSSFLAPVTN